MTDHVTFNLFKDMKIIFATCGVLHHHNLDNAIPPGQNCLGLKGEQHRPEACVALH